MKKRILSTILAFGLAIGICNLFPADNSSGAVINVSAETSAGKPDKDGFVIATDADGYKYITDYTGSGVNITIPDGVVWIAEEAFIYNDKITSVTFPKSFNGWIEDYAFWGCISLKTITFEGTIGDIGRFSFGACIDLKTVTFNGGINGGEYAGGIGYCAFAYCNSLKTVEFKNSQAKVSYIGESAFYGCFELSSINLPSNTTEICSYAFANCINLVKLTVPKNTKKINEYAIGYMYDYDKGEAVFADEHSKAWMAYFSFSDKMKYMEEKIQKSITMAVTKDSPAEKYAKDNGIRYEYVKDEQKTAASSAAASSKNKLAAPTGFKTSTSTSKITLSWGAVDGADAYKVYKYDSKTGKYKAYKTVSSAKCTVSGLKSGTTYKFKVAALYKVDGKYVAGNTSKVVTASTT